MAMMDIEMKAEKIMQLEEENGNLKRMLEEARANGGNKQRLMELEDENMKLKQQIERITLENIAKMKEMAINVGASQANTGDSAKVKQLEEEMRKANEKIAEMVALLAHEKERNL